MPRTNLDGKPIRRVLEWLLNRDLTDAELATALEMPTTNFHRRKDAEDFPTFHELDRFGAIFNLSARVLQISFGMRGLDELVLLDDEELHQFLELGGANHPCPALVVEIRKEFVLRNGKHYAPRSDRRGGI